MKRFTILLIVIGLTHGITTMAQTKPFRFGIKVTPNVGWLKPHTDDYESEGAAMGFGWGFISDISLTDNYFFTTGFDMEWDASALSYPDKKEGIDETGVLTRDYKLRYIDIPLSLKMKTDKFDKFNYFGQLGMKVGFRIGSKSNDAFAYTDQDGQKIINETENENINEDINLVRAAILFGAGAEYSLAESTSLMVSIAYLNGITNILNGTNDVDTQLKERAIFNSFQLNIGIIF